MTCADTQLTDLGKSVGRLKPQPTGNRQIQITNSLHTQTKKKQELCDPMKVAFFTSKDNPSN